MPENQVAAGETLKVAVDAGRVRAGDKVTFGIRPEHLSLAGPGDAVAAKVVFVETLGHATHSYLTAGEALMTVLLPGDVRPSAGQTLSLRVAADQAHLFDADGESLDRL
jgi:ABC-type sugar transport system ATPase subunit